MPTGMPITVINATKATRGTAIQKITAATAASPGRAPSRPAICRKLAPTDRGPTERHDDNEERHAQPGDQGDRGRDPAELGACRCPTSFHDPAADHRAVGLSQLAVDQDDVAPDARRRFEKKRAVGHDRVPANVAGDRCRLIDDHEGVAHCACQPGSAIDGDQRVDALASRKIDRAVDPDIEVVRVLLCQRRDGCQEEYQHRGNKGDEGEGASGDHAMTRPFIGLSSISSPDRAQFGRHEWPYRPWS